MPRQYYHNEQGGSDITVVSNVTWADAVSLTFTPDASTSYYLFFSGLLGNSVATSDIQYRVLEGANVIASGNVEPKDTSPTEYRSFAGFLRHTEGGSPSSRTFKIQIKLETSGPTGRIRTARLTAIRHETGDVFEETTAAFTTASAVATSVESISSATVDGTTDSYLLFGCAKLQAGTANSSIWVTLDIPKIVNSAEIQLHYAIESFSDTTSAVHKMCGGVLLEDPSVTDNGGAYHLLATTPAGTTSVSDRRILALKVTGDNVFYNYDANGNGAGTSGTSYSDAYTYTPTIAATANHLVFLSLSMNNNSTIVSSYSDFTIAGNVISESVREYGGGQDSHMYIGIEALSSGSNAIKARSKGESATPTQFVYEISFVVWQIPSSVANSKTINVSQASSTILRRTAGKRLAIAFPGSTILKKAVSKILSLTLGNATTLAATGSGQTTDKTITLAALAEALSLQKSVGKIVIYNNGSVVTNQRAIDKFISLAQASSALVYKSTVKIVSIVQASALVIASYRTVYPVISVAVSNLVRNVTATGKRITLAQPHSVIAGQQGIISKVIEVLFGAPFRWDEGTIQEQNFGQAVLSEDGYSFNTLSGDGSVYGNSSNISGKWYYEVTIPSDGSSYLIGFAPAGTDLLNSMLGLTGNTFGIGEVEGFHVYSVDGETVLEITQQLPINGFDFGQQCTVGIAIDFDLGHLWVSYDGWWLKINSPGPNGTLDTNDESDPAADTFPIPFTYSGDPWFPALFVNESTVTINPEPLYPIPSGFKYWSLPSIEAELEAHTERVKILNIALASAVTLRRVFGKPIAIAVSSVTTLLPFIFRALTITVSLANSVTLTTQAAAGRLISIARASTVTLRRNMEKNITITRASTVTVRRQITKLINITLSPVVTAVKRLALRINITLGNIVTMTNVKAFGKLITTITQASTTRLIREAGKVIKPTLGQAIILRRAMSRFLNVSVSNSVSLIRRISHRIDVLLGNTVLATAIRQYYRTITAQLTSSASLLRTASKIITVPLGHSIRITRGQFKTINVTLGSAASIVSNNTRSLILNIMQVQNVSQSASLAKIIYAYLGNAVDVLRRLIRDTTGATEPAFVRSGNNVFLVTVTGHDGEGEETLRFSTEGILTRPSDTPASTYFDPRVIDPGNFERHLRARGIQGGSVGTGDVLLTSGSPGGSVATLDYLLDWAFDGYSITIQSLTNIRQAVSLATTLFVGTIEQLLTGDAYNKLGFKIHDRLSDLDLPFLTATYAGTTITGGDGTADGNLDLKGNKKQKIYGTVYNVEPQISNPFDLVLDFSHGAVSSIVLYDGALELTNDGDVANLAALLAWVKVPGHYKTCLALGKAVAGGMAEFGWTADVVEGSTSPAGQRTAAQILRRMFEYYGISEGGLVPETFAALDNYNSSECGIIIRDDETFLSAARRLLDGPGADVLPNSLGKFGVWYFTAPSTSPDSATVELEEDTIIGDSLQRIATESTGRGVAVYRVTMRYAHNELVMNTTQIAGAVSDDQRTFVGSEWRSVVEEDLSVLDRHRNAIEVSFDTCFISSADAEAEAARHLALFSVRRDAYRVKAMLDYANAAAIGSVVSLKAPRFGLDNGQKFIVIGRVDDYENKTVELDLWG